MRLWCIGLLAVALLAFLRQSRLPADFGEALQNSADLELVSLFPEPTSRRFDRSGNPLELAEQRQCRQYEILGRTRPTREAVQPLLSQIRWMLIGPEPRVRTRCFRPRHALRTEYRGTRFDLLLCYECSQIALFRNQLEVGRFQMRFWPTAETADRLLRQAGQPPAP